MSLPLAFAIGGLATCLVGGGTFLGLFHKYWEARATGWLLSLWGIGLYVGTLNALTS